MGTPGRIAAHAELSIGLLDDKRPACRAFSLGVRVSRPRRGRVDIRSPKSKTPELLLARAVYVDISLTMSYFHTGTRTIIGAEGFHFPVRDGKEWDHLAMVIRLNWLPGCSHEQLSQIMEFESGL